MRTIAKNLDYLTDPWSVINKQMKPAMRQEIKNLKSLCDNQYQHITGLESELCDLNRDEIDKMPLETREGYQKLRETLKELIAKNQQDVKFYEQRIQEAEEAYAGKRSIIHLMEKWIEIDVKRLVAGADLNKK